MQIGLSALSYIWKQVLSMVFPIENHLFIGKRSGNWSGERFIWFWNIDVFCDRVVEQTLWAFQEIQLFDLKISCCLPFFYTLNIFFKQCCKMLDEVLFIFKKKKVSSPFKVQILKVGFAQTVQSKFWRYFLVNYNNKNYCWVVSLSFNKTKGTIFFKEKSFVCWMVKLTSH